MLNNLPKTTTRSGKRIGRGYGSGKGGHTVGKGQKGQRSRSGFSHKIGFEGGQLPLYRRLPRIRGWGNKPVTDYFAVNLGKLEQVFAYGEKVTPHTLVEKKLLPRKALRQTSRIKIIGGGQLKKKLVFEDVVFSKGAAVSNYSSSERSESRKPASNLSRSKKNPFTQSSPPPRRPRTAGPSTDKKSSKSSKPKQAKKSNS